MSSARLLELRPGLLRLWWAIEELVPDRLWERVTPLLPPAKPLRHRHPGRVHVPTVPPERLRLAVP